MPSVKANRTPLALLAIFCLMPAVQTAVTIYWQWRTVVTYPLLKALMVAIPLTVIGILPGFWLLNLMWNQPIGGYPNPVFFTATGMIGMIALSGIATRNAILLIEFVHEQLKEGHSLRAALIRSGARRASAI